MKSFYFIRHGETDWNLQGHSMGQADVPLNETGISQAYVAANILQSVEFTAIVSSPLVRAVKTAEIITEAIDKQIHIFDEFKECDWGSDQKADFKNEDSDWFRAWQQGTLADIECFPALKKRVLKGLEKTFALPEPVLIVAHGGTYWAMSKILGFTYSSLPNCLPIYISSPVAAGRNWDIAAVGDDERLNDSF